VSYIPKFRDAASSMGDTAFLVMDVHL